ncbi:MAG: AAA family ATPase [Hahellaceae bacterium]|nr:AAA family ATPase [Hahellaceae bacterium]
MIDRHLARELQQLASEYRIVTLTGPRQAGKTTLTRQTFPDYTYVSLEDPDQRALANDDPRAFLALFTFS